LDRGGIVFNVRVPEQVLKSVAFIGDFTHKDEEGHLFGDLLATGFFVSVRSQFRELRHVYFVTAKHVVDDLGDRAPYILVNAKEGRPVHLTNFRPFWFFHPDDKTADIAVLQLAEQPNTDLLAVLIDDFVTQADVDSGQVVAQGDEVFVTGLFTPAPGEKRNMPIARHGNVAMLPKEQIQTELGFADVYLIEGRSIGGLSGSPAFVRRTETVEVRMADGRTTTLNSPGPFKLLGCTHGHWDIKESEMNKTSIQHDRKHGVNLGIALVTPASKIADILNQPGLKMMRDLADEDLHRRSR
jgi:hypothetical protein